MLRLSRSHDQNRRRAGETAGKAAMLAVQCDVLKQENRGILLTDTETVEEKKKKTGQRSSCRKELTRAEKRLYFNR